jgi:glycosyltransferase involved in cell wall biosynthesis
MKILFAYENPLPNSQADAEVFVNTAKYLARLAPGSTLHVPLAHARDRHAVQALAEMAVLRAWAPSRSAALRHLFCGLTIVLRAAFRQADLVYTRNLWVASLALLFGQKVAFDHYRPWPAQIPPLQRWIRRLFCHPRLLINICHSEYTKTVYLDLGIPAAKLICIHNGYEPQHLSTRQPIALAKRQIGLPAERKTVVYTGRINHKKGLGLVIDAARALPDIQFILVGAERENPVQQRASMVPNIMLVPWQPPTAMGSYLFAADVLLIPPSLQPLVAFGSTVLPLKLYLYLAAGRPILAGACDDVREILRHGENAFLCEPDSLASLVAAIQQLTSDTALAGRLAAQALADSRKFTWEARARRIAAVLADRWDAPCPVCDRWEKRQSRAWRVQSWRWLVHLVRTRYWVLPPPTPQQRTASPASVLPQARARG